MKVNEILKWRCQKHKSFPIDMICTDGDVKDRFVCLQCPRSNSIDILNVISMKCILDANENDILEAYPPLKDKKLSDKLRDVSQEQSIEKIDLYFKQLKSDFEREYCVAYQRAKEKFIKQEQARMRVLEAYSKISEIEKLKELIVSDKEGAEKDLDEFIKDKWNKAEQNRKIMQYLMNQYDNHQHLSFDEPNSIAQKIIDNLKNINFFKQEFNLIKSTFKASQNVAIEKIDDFIFQIKKDVSFGWCQVFLDPTLDPLSKYILQIEFEMKPNDINSRFVAGIVEDDGKDNDYAFTSNMCYHNLINTRGITNYIRGNHKQTGSKVNGKCNFEFRICLNQKLLRVASLPDYSSIAELDDHNKIDQNISYRFFLGLASYGDIIRINSLRIVDQFDGKM